MTKTSLKAISKKEVEFIAQAIGVEATKAALTKAFKDNEDTINKAHDDFTAKAKEEADARRRAKAEELAEKAKKIQEAAEKAEAEAEAKKGKGKGKKDKVSCETNEDALKVDDKVSCEAGYKFTNASIIHNDIAKTRRTMHVFNQLRHRITYSINIDFAKSKLTVKDGNKLVARVNLRTKNFYLRTYDTGKEVITKQATLEDVLRACGYEI